MSTCTFALIYTKYICDKKLSIRSTSHTHLRAPLHPLFFETHVSMDSYRFLPMPTTTLTQVSWHVHTTAGRFAALEQPVQTVTLKRVHIAGAWTHGRVDEWAIDFVGAWVCHCMGLWAHQCVSVQSSTDAWVSVNWRNECIDVNEWMTGWVEEYRHYVPHT